MTELGLPFELAARARADRAELEGRLRQTRAQEAEWLALVAKRAATIKAEQIELGRLRTAAEASARAAAEIERACRPEYEQVAAIEAEERMAVQKEASDEGELRAATFHLEQQQRTSATADSLAVSRARLRDRETKLAATRAERQGIRSRLAAARAKLAAAVVALQPVPVAASRGKR